MKRVTLVMEDDMYTSLLDAASERSRSEIRRVSMGEIIRDMISKEQKNGKTQTSHKADATQRRDSAGAG